MQQPLAAYPVRRLPNHDSSPHGVVVDPRAGSWLGLPPGRLPASEVLAVKAGHGRELVWCGSPRTLLTAQLYN
jgi:hypothetical protein